MRDTSRVATKVDGLALLAAIMMALVTAQGLSCARDGVRIGAAMGMEGQR